MKLYYDIFSTALGSFSVAVDEQGAVVGAGFGGKESLPTRQGGLIHNPKMAGAARRQIQEYLNGKTHKFDLTLSPRGTPFQQSVWAALRKIPFGATRSYKEIAAQTGNVEGARAVGGAVGSNPICLIIPCHRVIASDGSLGGYAFGLPAKRRLLELEGVPGVGARP